jgi:hypothetical protein
MLLLCCYFSLYHCIWLYENNDIYQNILFTIEYFGDTSVCETLNSLVFAKLDCLHN